MQTNKQLENMSMNVASNRDDLETLKNERTNAAKKLAGDTKALDDAIEVLKNAPEPLPEPIPASPPPKPEDVKEEEKKDENHKKLGPH